MRPAPPYSRTFWRELLGVAALPDGARPAGPGQAGWGRPTAGKGSVQQPEFRWRFFANLRRQYAGRPPGGTRPVLARFWLHSDTNKRPGAHREPPDAATPQPSACPAGGTHVHWLARLSPTQRYQPQRT